jgi:hypothetical protein
MFPFALAFSLKPKPNPQRPDPFMDRGSTSGGDLDPAKPRPDSNNPRRINSARSENNKFNKII